MDMNTWRASITSDDSDFDELADIQTPDVLDYPDGDVAVHHTSTSGLEVQAGKAADSKIIPFSSIHRPVKGFQHVRPTCWMNEPINVQIIHVKREEHPHMTRKAFNPNLYTIEISHGEYRWMVKRRYKHFHSLHTSLRLFRAKCSLPVPTKGHREKRQSFREERKVRKIKKKEGQKVLRFPKKPEFMVREEALEKRRDHLEKYLQSILESKWYRNHTDVLKFLEVSELSFVNHLGQKWKEGDITKCSGGRRISIGCCGCLKKYHVAVRWSKRWLVVKDTFIAYIRPSDGVVCDVMLMDSVFKVVSGMSDTGAQHGVLVQNLTRHLLAKAWTSRKADEWQACITEAAEKTGKDFTSKNIRYDSYAPVRENSYARWFVDGSSYFEAVAEALEKAREEIFITDWWLSPEIYLKRHVTDRERWRLDKVLARKAKEGVKVFIILYKEIEASLTINSYYSKRTLMKESPNIVVIRHPDHVATSNRVILWAHHEKVVVIDQKTAFLGGFDMCYGRWDDEQHRMTDLGSVSFAPLPDLPKGQDSLPVHKNGSVNKFKTLSSIVRPPSTILESPEALTSDSGIFENSQAKTSSDTSQPTSPSLEEDGSKDSSNDKLGHSMSSEGDFGSADLLTDNDSLENGDKIAYHNIVADVHVQSDEINNSVCDARKGQKPITGTCNDLAKDYQSVTCAQDSAQTETKEKCNICFHNSVNMTTYSGNSTGVPNQGKCAAHMGSDGDYCENLRRDISDGSLLKEGETNHVLHREAGEDTQNLFRQDSVDLQHIEAQIICDDADKKKPSNELVSDDFVRQTILKHVEKGKDITIEQVRESINKSDVKINIKIDEKIIKENQDRVDAGLIKRTANSEDVNRNETKCSVRFKELEGGEIQEEHINPEQAVPVEGAPRGIKSERWVSRKLKQRFPFLRERNEEEDQPDEKDKSDKSDSDDEGSGSNHNRLRNKWRMVLNIKKLELNVLRPDEEETISPRSPYARNLQSPHHSFTSRIRKTFTKQDSDEDSMNNILYPWKGLFRFEDSPVTVRSVMKMGEVDTYETLEGSSKLWIGKDYINFIHKDPVDLHNPFEDFIARDKTPRMPWHDIGAVVYGEAARDVARHFIQRWNFCKMEKFKANKRYPILMPKSYGKCKVSSCIQDITYGCTTQILRSVSGWSAGINKVEQSIHNAYLDCIKNAKHFIYIENQFFISTVGDHSMVRNQIAEALVERITRAYQSGETFRVYVIMPLLPAFEGEIGANGGYSIQAVLHWNYKSVSKGENSLWANLLKRVDDPKKYIVFCGLRAHDELKGKLVTELVYVHSKLMIVDDDTVIIGSANINDRSMLGTRDSEIAILVQDNKKFPVNMNGKEHMAGSFAASLRRTLFREHLGIGEGNKEIDLSDPVCDSFYKNVWIAQASINTTIYHKVFKCIPDDCIKSFSEIKQTAGVMPLSESDPELARIDLQKVKGRIVFLPLYFLEHEDSIMATGANKESMLPMKLWL
ncbi:phospholipase D1-like isoform X2 [Dreissena polymorpha]|uniref:phospholipase D1-like isoform X2 n=1 Tax=Dreissena polymorpha TaxID=45954 RepID=UPI0022652EF9|nr:phospholipase D1-like isoform X2 [Dreissena polymorpha]